jgi:hypothetical protein
MCRSVSMETRLRTGRPGWNSRRGAMMGFSSLRHRVQTGSGAHPASYLMGTGCSYSVVEWSGRAADHSPPSSA